MVKIQNLSRISRLAVALLLILGGFAPVLTTRKASAYSLPDQRYIQMSSSAASADDVVYLLGFITNQGGSDSDIGGLVIEFCSNSPILGDTCTAPTGFNAHAFTGDNTLDLGAQTGTQSVDFTVDTTNATANRIILQRSPATTQIPDGTSVTIELGTPGAPGSPNVGVSANTGGISNPSTSNSTFYARILTYTTAAAAEAYTPTSIGSPVDAGGIALSTADQITVIAKVPERLTFCVFTDDDTGSGSSNSCGTAGTPNNDMTTDPITLGDTNGVLRDSGPFVDENAKYTIATNALYDVVVRVSGSTLKTTPTCQEVDAPGEPCRIDAIGAVATASVPGSEQFGFCSYLEAGTAAGLTFVGPYDDATCEAQTSQTAGTNVTGGAGTATFGFDNNNTDGTTSTYGDDFAQKTPGTFSTGRLVFVGNISVTTEPGIYTTTLTFIATGTY